MHYTLRNFEHNYTDKPQILCVDDEPSNISLLTAMLSPRGYEVLSAADGQEALEKIKAHRVDLCLLDVMLPGIDGFEVCRQIKSEEALNAIPVIMITAYSDTQSRVRGIEAGAEDFISKPFISAEVLARIKMLLHVKSRNERRNQDAASATEEANKAKNQFLGKMCHELRTPMNGVLGMTQLLETTDLTAEQLEYIEVLSSSGQNMMHLIDDLLDFNKIREGTITVKLAPFSLQHCIDDVVTMHRIALEEKGLALHVEFDSDIPPLLTGDQLRLQQILINLLGNAVKFTKLGEITLSTRISERRGDSCLVQIAIRDTGIGIPGEELESIFLPFVQQDGSSTRAYGQNSLPLGKLADALSAFLPPTIASDFVHNLQISAGIFYLCFI